MSERLEEKIAEHYGSNDLLQRLDKALVAAGKSPRQLRADDLKPVDEFHIGGAAASEELMAQIDLQPGMDVLDIGAGIGGTARLLTQRFGCRVTGIDLTPEYVEVAQTLSDRVGLGDRTTFECASATALPFAAESFDAATLLHVGMNIADKPALMRQAYQVLKPGGHFAVYDVMKTGNAPIDFPVPWAQTPDSSHLASIDDYRHAAEQAGFECVAWRDRRAFAIAFFERMQAKAQTKGPPALGIHLLLGRTAKIKIENMLANIKAGRVAPTELVLVKPREK